jgi:ribosomal protein S18 acetylase RimI-like enzyme
MNRYGIREATADDLDVLTEMLYRLDAHVSGAPREILAMTEAGEAALRDRLRRLVDAEEARLLVVTLGGEVVAMGGIVVWGDDGTWTTPERRARRTAVIDDVWVDEDHRRRGLTRRLLDALVDFAESAGAREIVLEYSLANPEAEATWARFGFRPTGVRAAATTASVRAALGDDGDGGGTA